MIESQNQGRQNNFIIEAILLARPLHWVKNLALFAAIFLTGELFDKTELIKVVWGFVAFCFATSATYIFNDILDAPRDRLHPIKKFRPIASGAIPPAFAFVEAVGFIFGAFFVYTFSPLNSLFFFLLM